jgi:hypothetical protein
MKLKGE